MKLHRIHAAPVATRVQFDGLGITWRGEGGDVALKTAMARRLAVCWNVLIGAPTDALEEDIMGRLLTAIAAGDLPAAQALVRQMDAPLDWTDGRLHDCVQCGAPPPPVVIEPDEPDTDGDGQMEMGL